MDSLRKYLNKLTPAEQAAYATRAGTTIGYLRKQLSTGKRFGGALVRRLWEESSREVSRTELRPDIWPPRERQGRAA